MFSFLFRCRMDAGGAEIHKKVSVENVLFVRPRCDDMIDFSIWFPRPNLLVWSSARSFLWSSKWTKRLPAWFFPPVSERCSSSLIIIRHDLLDGGSCNSTSKPRATWFREFDPWRGQMSGEISCLLWDHCSIPQSLDASPWTPEQLCWRLPDASLWIRW